MAPGVFRVVFYEFTVSSDAFDISYAEVVVYPLALSMF